MNHSTYMVIMALLIFMLLIIFYFTGFNPDFDFWDYDSWGINQDWAKAQDWSKTKIIDADLGDAMILIIISALWRSWSK